MKLADRLSYTFQKRQHQLDDCIVAVIHGFSRVSDSATDAAQTLGFEDPEDDNRQRISTALDIVLVYLMVHLEAATGEAIELLSAESANSFIKYDPSKCITVMRSQKNNYNKRSALNTESYVKKSLLSNAAKNSNYTESAEGKPLTSALCSFARIELLNEAHVIRNLIVHNNGFMNERTHRFFPIVAIGDRPQWGMNLLYDVRDGICLLGEHLAHSLVVSEN